jgi:hypothetical protein
VILSEVILAEMLKGMTSKRQTLRRVVSIIEQEFVHQKLRKYGSVYLWSIKDGFSGWLGLNTIMGHTHGIVGINPIVGIVSEDIETLVQRFEGSPSRDQRPTISVSLGYLMPEKRYLEWRFGPLPTHEIEVEVLKLSGAIRCFGIPFVESMASVSVIVKNLEELRFTYNESAVYRLPAAYLVMGNRDRAQRYVEQQVAALGERTDQAANDYRQFGRAFLNDSSELETPSA